MAKVLIIDDDHNIRTVLQKTLEQSGHETLVAGEGKQGVQLFESKKPDLVILDVAMPEMDGLEVLRVIKEIEKEQNRPKDQRAKVLMLTGYADKKSVIKCYQLGCDDYVVKPLFREVLLQKLEKLGFNLVHEEVTTTELLIGQMISATIEGFKQGKVELPSLPYIVQELQDVMDNPSASNSDIAKIIEQDTGLSIKLIAIANSPYYRGIQKAGDIKSAIDRLGLDNIQSVAGAVANKNLYDTIDPDIKKIMGKIWIHSLACAHCSKEIAKKILPADQDKVFVKGLIHDVGATLLIRNISENYSDKNKIDLEVLIAGVYEVHANFGATLLKKWQFGQDFIDVAKFHEWTNFNDKTSKEVLIVNLADSMAEKIGFGIFNKEIPELSTLKSSQLLTISTDVLDLICQDIKRLIHESTQAIPL